MNDLDPGTLSEPAPGTGQGWRMASSGGGADLGSELDELRRRIYRPDATDADRARYRELLGQARHPGRSTHAEPDPDPDPGRPAVAVSTDPPRRRGGGLVLAGALALLAATGVGIILLPRGEPALPGPSPRAIAADGPTRSEFVENLAAGGTAGIAAYLVTHPSPSELRGASRFFTIERSGTGPHSFSLNGTPADAESGRATVLLVVQVQGRAAWTAYRVREQSDDPSPLQAIARRSGDQRSGVLSSATFRYPGGGRPVRLDVDVPAGVRWGAAVVFSD
jgi:hypothetical protein